MGYFKPSKMGYYFNPVAGLLESAQRWVNLAHASSWVNIAI